MQISNYPLTSQIRKKIPNTGSESLDRYLYYVKNNIFFVFKGIHTYTLIYRLVRSRQFYL